jgi:hypothetical protein
MHIAVDATANRGTAARADRTTSAQNRSETSPLPTCNSTGPEKVYCLVCIDSVDAQFRAVGMCSISYRASRYVSSRTDRRNIPDEHEPS